jgi:hypothetical protein
MDLKEAIEFCSEQIERLSVEVEYWEQEDDESRAYAGADETEKELDFYFFITNILSEQQKSK